MNDSLIYLDETGYCQIIYNQKSTFITVIYLTVDSLIDETEMIEQNNKYNVNTTYVNKEYLSFMDIDTKKQFRSLKRIPDFDFNLQIKHVNYLINKRAIILKDVHEIIDKTIENHASLALAALALKLSQPPYWVKNA